MTYVALKEKLHEYIEHADEQKVKAIYTLIERDIEDSGYEFDDETLNFLEKRRKEFLESGHSGFTVEESMEYVKTELKKRGL